MNKYVIRLYSNVASSIHLLNEPTLIERITYLEYFAKILKAGKTRHVSVPEAPDSTTEDIK